MKRPAVAAATGETAGMGISVDEALAVGGNGLAGRAGRTFRGQQ